MRRIVAALLLPLCLWGCDKAAHEPATTVELRECRVKGIETAIQCGSIQVPENRDHPGAHSIPIHFALIPAQSRKRRDDAIFVLAGGPGQAASSIAGALSPLFAKLNRDRDIVFIDQRGTGGSNPLKCPEPSRDQLVSGFDSAATMALVGACAEKLSTAGNDLTQYLTVDAIKDYEDVRRALGYQSVNLWGGSYGTRVALEYLRQFPGSLRSIVLDGVAPADMRLPVSFSIDADAALDRLVGDCAANEACQAHYPHLGADLAHFFSSIAASALHPSATNPLTGRHEQFTLDRETLATLVRMPLYSSMSASIVPFAVGQAAEGNLDPLLAINYQAGGDLDNSIALGMHLSVVCGEDLPIIHPADLAPLEASRFGRAFYDQYQRMCSRWPSRAAPPEFYAAPQSALPVLMLTGGADPATPARHAERSAQHLSNVQSLVAPYVGHGVSLQGCAPELVERFIRDPQKPLGDTSCLARIPRPLFFEPIAAGAQ